MVGAMDAWWTRVDLRQQLGAEVTAGRRISGGDVADAAVLTLSDGRHVFAKTHADPPPRFFTTEAAGLRWLADAGSLGIGVPEVLAVSDAHPAHLVLPWIPSGRPTPATEPAFGRALAALHLAGAPAFGSALADPSGATTGSLALPDDPQEDWPTFLASNRLLPLARIGRDGRVKPAHPPEPALPDDLIADLQRLAGRLPDLGVPDEPPARLHGDLWAGNRMVDDQGRSWLIDPSAHGGHREADLAMMALFGGFDDVCWTAYDEAHPLADGWRERVLLHQVHPLVVHAIRFGGGYVDAARRAVGRYC
ncbi:fructosamine kinase family protein [soil metagenome]